jgi:hypothetical protein
MYLLSIQNYIKHGNSKIFVNHWTLIINLRNVDFLSRYPCVYTISLFSAGKYDKLDSSKEANISHLLCSRQMNLLFVLLIP